jgi:hypothetical protein
MNQPTIDRFKVLVKSLKKYERAEQIDEAGQNIIEELYTDPLEGDFVLESMLEDQTTLLIGRKGTGKSTIISRFQHEIRKDKTKLSLYIDVRTIYEQASNSTPKNIVATRGLSPDDQRRHELYKHFINNVIQEIYREINKGLFRYKVTKYIFGGLTEEDFKKELENILETVLTPKFDDITSLIETNSSDSYSQQNTRSESLTGEVTISPEVAKDKVKFFDLKSGSSQSESTNQTISNSDQYSNLLIRYFNIIELIKEIKALLEEVGISQVYVCLDDASELDKEALDIFMRTIVAPLHNDSSSFFRFKIAFYPGRDHLPNIDRRKIDSILLDYYDLYRSSGVDRVEAEAISYTKRLLETRFKYYFGNDVELEDFFDTQRQRLTIDDYYKIIFQISDNVPRNIGKLLWFVSKRTIHRGEKITKRALQEAAEEQYRLDTEPVLTKSEFIRYKNYDEKYEREHLRRLLEMIIEKAKFNKRHIAASDAEIFKQYNQSNAPSNYLYVPPEVEELLSTLELNFFISKFSHQKDRGSGSGDKYIPPKEVIVYTLNYGLCQKENIIVDEGSDRKFRVERVFDYTKLIFEWANFAQIVRCSSCNTTYDIKEWEEIQRYNKLCRKCNRNTCHIENLELPESDKTEVSEDIKIKERYFEILNTLRIDNGLNAREIGEEIDSSTSSIAQYVRVDRVLMEKDLVERKQEGQQNKYYITGKALKLYFDEESD